MAATVTIKMTVQELDKVREHLKAYREMLKDVQSKAFDDDDAVTRNMAYCRQSAVEELLEVFS